MFGVKTDILVSRRGITNTICSCISIVGRSSNVYSLMTLFVIFVVMSNRGKAASDAGTAASGSSVSQSSAGTPSVPRTKTQQKLVDAILLLGRLPKRSNRISDDKVAEDKLAPRLASANLPTRSTQLATRFAETGAAWLAGSLARRHAVFSLRAHMLTRALS